MATSYIFGKSTPDTYESLKQKRLTAARLQQAASTAPRNVGEGLSALGQAIGYRRLMNSVNATESAGQDEANSQYTSALGRLMGGQLGGGVQPTVSTSGPTVPPVASAPLTANPAGLPNDIIKAVDRVDPPIKNAYDLAARKIGLNETDQKAALASYMADGGVNLDPATRAWCADFVNATLAQTGVEGTGSSMARSFLDWGQPVDQPQKGDVAVFKRGDPNGPYGHVGFFDSYNPDGTIKVLGGNQGDAVSLANYSQDDLLGFRRAQQNVEEIGTLLSNPYLGEGQRAVLGQLLEQSIQAMQPPDPMEAIQLEMAQLQLEQARNGGGAQDLPDGYEGKRLTAIDGGLVPGTPEYQAFMLGSSEGEEYGTSIVWGRDPEGNIVPGQVSKNGSIKLSEVPEGWTPDPGLNAQAQAEGRAIGTATGQAKVGLDGALLKTQQAIDLIDSIAADPALPSITGTVQGGILAPGIPLLSGGQAGTDLAVKTEQLKGKVFVEAFESLKGAGQITETEGAAATAAIGRLNRAQSADAYKSALSELKTALRDLSEVAKKRAGSVSAPLPGQPSSELSDEELFKQYGIGP